MIVRKKQEQYHAERLRLREQVVEQRREIAALKSELCKRTERCNRLAEERTSLVKRLADALFHLKRERGDYDDPTPWPVKNRWCSYCGHRPGEKEQGDPSKPIETLCAKS